MKICKMHKIITILFTIVLLISCNGQNNSKNTNLTAVEFHEKIKELKNPQLIDVRTPEEFEGGHLENAINIDWNGSDFLSLTNSLDKTQPIMVYCLSGGRSAAAAEALRKNGFQQVYEMDGGMMQWRSKKLPETKGENQIIQSMTLKQYQQLLVSDKLVLVDFYAPWCGPCKKMEPYLKKIAEDSKDEVVIIRIDVDLNSQLSNDLKITGIPVLKLYKNEKLVWDQVGFVEETVVREQLKINTSN